MHVELSGFVVVTYTIGDTKDDLALTFPADEFSSPGVDSGFDNTAGELRYRGIWNASEENVLARLSFTATRDGFIEKTWEIVSEDIGALNNPRVAEDRITVEFVED